MTKARLVSLLLFAATLLPLAASAQEAGRLVAIQQRKYRMANELVIGGMFEPLDAFSKGLAAEGAFLFHFNDDWAWEILRGGYVQRLDTGLRTQLLRDFGVVPTATPALKFYAGSALQWSPLYGKFALSNSSLIHLEAFVTFGGVLGFFNSAGDDKRAGPELGVGTRLFLNQTVSVRFDARDAYFFAATRQNVLFFSLGLSINLGGND